MSNQHRSTRDMFWEYWVLNFSLELDCSWNWPFLFLVLMISFDPVVLYFGPWPHHVNVLPCSGLCRWGHESHGRDWGRSHDQPRPQHRLNRVLHSVTIAHLEKITQKRNIDNEYELQIHFLNRLLYRQNIFDCIIAVLFSGEQYLLLGVWTQWELTAGSKNISDF